MDAVCRGLHRKQTCLLMIGKFVHQMINMITKTILLSVTLAFSGCSADWLYSNTTKAVLREVSKMVFTSALQSFTTDRKVDFGHAMAQGLWEQGSVAIDSGAVKRIANAWSADHLPKLALATSTAYQIASPKNSKQQAQVTDAIASAIDAAALHNEYPLPTK